MDKNFMIKPANGRRQISLQRVKDYRVIYPLVVLMFLLSPLQAHAIDILVSNVSQLVNAINNMGPGQRIILTPGTYILNQRFVIPASRSGTAAEPITIMAQDGLGAVTLDANGNEEAFLFTGARFIIIEGLRITGGAYHAIKIDAPSTDIWIRNNALFDNTQGSDLNSQASAIKGGGAGPVGGVYAGRVTIEKNEIYQVTPFGGNNFQGVDCNGCKDWVVRSNFIHDIRGAGLTGTCIQFKSGSSNTIIENNIIRNCGLVGINYGGFGTPSWGGETFEHVGGIVRNNIISGCSDAGISVINVKDGKIYNNTLYNNGFTPDIRVDALNVQYRNNILDRPLNLRDGTIVIQSNNLVLAAPSNGSLFVNAAGNDFHLKDSATVAIDKGFNLASDVPTDFEGTTRPQGLAFDIGADELGAPSTPTPTPTPTPSPAPSPTPTSWGIPGDRPVSEDYDGDNKADIAVWRPGDGNWYLLLSAGGSSIQSWGVQGDKPVPGDYDGDGRADLAVFRPSNGVWYILNSLGGFQTLKFGRFSDTPALGDYDGNGKTDIAIFRPSQGGWGIKLSGGGNLIKVRWGLPGDLPVPADYDGDGKADVAVWRPSEGNWYIQLSTGGVRIMQWGQIGDTPIPGDYDGDGLADLCVWRSSDRSWYINFSSGGFRVTPWGQISDVPVPADYDGDGKVDITVWRPSDGKWYISP